MILLRPSFPAPRFSESSKDGRPGGIGSGWATLGFSASSLPVRGFQRSSTSDRPGPCILRQFSSARPLCAGASLDYPADSGSRLHSGATQRTRCPRPKAWVHRSRGHRPRNLVPRAPQCPERAIRDSARACHRFGWVRPYRAGTIPWGRSPWALPTAAMVSALRAAADWQQRSNMPQGSNIPLQNLTFFPRFLACEAG